MTEEPYTVKLPVAAAGVHNVAERCCPCSACPRTPDFLALVRYVAHQAGEPSVFALSDMPATGTQSPGAILGL